jgi:molybdopterin molybdotransferase
MLPFEKALKIVLDSAGRLGSERVDITRAVNRILAEDVKSDIDMPLSDRAVMDGFACRRRDLANALKVIETIPAGVWPQKEIGPNQCSKIMTGAPVPKCADCVVMVEFTENLPDHSIRFTGEKTEDHIRRQSDDVRAGQVVLLKGTCIKPQHIAVLASAGQAQVLVSKKPKVAVIATGDELVEPQMKPSPWQLRNSNSFQLVAQLENLSATATYYGIAADSVDEIDRIFKQAASENDVVVISGGVSMGDFDFVPGVLRQNNIELLFEKIALKPGKPTIFGKSENLYCFGIPGNPVSTFVVFELLVKPFLYKLMGHDFAADNIRLELSETISRKDTERLGWFPVRITDSGQLKHIEYHGSAHLNALSNANGLVSMDVGVSEIPKGTFIPVRLI